LLHKIRYYTEPLTRSETAFLLRKKNRELTLFRSAIRILLIFAVIIPLIGGILYSLSLQMQEEHPNLEAPPEEGSFLYFVVAFIVLLLLIGLAAFLVYNASLKKLLLDLKYKTKIIEQAEITAKKYMKQNNTCHLYIKSPTRLSIEVKPEDFAMFFPGDEINIEYSFHAKVYFGYF